MSTLPEAPWTKISVDFFGPVPTGETLLVIIDLYTQFPFIYLMKSTSCDREVEKFEHLFSILDILQNAKMITDLLLVQPNLKTI